MFLIEQIMISIGILFSLVLGCLANFTLTNKSMAFSLSPAAYDYGLNWTVSANFNKLTSTFTFTVNNTGNVAKYSSNCSSVRKIQVENCTISNNFQLMVFNKMNYVELYKLNSSTAFKLTYYSTIMANDAFMGVSGCLFFINSTKFMIYKVSTLNYSIVKNYSFSSEKLIVQKMSGEGGKIIVYAYNQSNSALGYFVVFDENLTKISIIRCRYVSTTAQSQYYIGMKYNPIQQILVRTTNLYVEGWSLVSNSLIMNIAKGSQLFSTAIVCKQFLITSDNWYVKWYNKTNLSAISSVKNVVIAPNLGEMTQNLKCFDSENAVGIYLLALEGKFVYNFYMNYTPINTTMSSAIVNLTNATSPMNIVEQVNSSKSGNLTINITNQGAIINQIVITVPDTQNQANSTQQSIASLQYLSQTVASISKLFKNATFQNATKTLSSAISIFATNPVLNKFARPMINLLDDFWFYKFHSVVYPEFVQRFTEQADLLSELRIKPSFFQLDFQMPQCEYQNQLYANQSILHPRAPDNIFNLVAVKDVYTSNSLICLIQFIILLILRYCLRLIKSKHKILKKIYFILRINTLWWAFFIGLIQGNISSLAFYSFVQFNEYVSFDFVSKIGLIVAAFFALIVILYSFMFYPFIFKYQITRYSKQTLEMTICTIKSFWLQSIFKCMRGLLLAVIHGIFINDQLSQLSGLIIISLIQFLTVIFLRHSFKTKAMFVLFFAYMLTFLIFNIGLMIYTLDLRDNPYTNNKQIIYNYGFMVLILTLFSIAVLRFLIKFLFQIRKKILQIKQNYQYDGTDELNQQNHYKQREVKNQIKIGVKMLKNINFKTCQAKKIRKENSFKNVNNLIMRYCKNKQQSSKVNLVIKYRQATPNISLIEQQSLSQANKQCNYKNNNNSNKLIDEIPEKISNYNKRFIVKIQNIAMGNKVNHSNIFNSACSKYF